jgi:hypothetical protein
MLYNLPGGDMNLGLHFGPFNLKYTFCEPSFFRVKPAKGLLPKHIVPEPHNLIDAVDGEVAS